MHQLLDPVDVATKEANKRDMLGGINMNITTLAGLKKPGQIVEFCILILFLEFTCACYWYILFPYMRTHVRKMYVMYTYALNPPKPKLLNLIIILSMHLPYN